MVQKSEKHRLGIWAKARQSQFSIPPAKAGGNSKKTGFTKALTG